MIRRLRLISGLTLFVFLTTHLLNHSLGLISLQALEWGREVFLAIWRNLPMSLWLYAALLTHFGLALWAVYQRRRLDLPPWEWAQLLLGLSIPPLIFLHLLGTRFASEVLGTNDTYIYVQLVYWVYDPWLGGQQAITVIVAWLHGCIGLHFWLRLKPWYGRLLPLSYAFALVMPLLALLGFLVSGLQVQKLALDPDWLATVQAEIGFADQSGLALIARLETAAWATFLVLLAATLAARWLRHLMERRRGLIFVTYPSGRRISAVKGATILEISRAGAVPHVSVCGGRGRCSTCRVRVGAGLEQLPPASDEEKRVLSRVRAGPNVRLACQTRPSFDLEVAPLIAPGADPQAARPRPGYLQGEEREITILFADIRGFTSLAEHKLPFDVVFLLNQYFRAMGEAVESVDGHLDKFIGDGVMALFGIRRGAREGSRRALVAARDMAQRMSEINAALRSDLPEPLKIGIGVHTGHVIVGEMGYGSAVSLTAIGDAVNTASRLEAMTKDLGVQLVVSEPAAQAAGLDLAAFRREEIELRGRRNKLAVFAIEDAGHLPVDGLESESSLSA